MTTTRRELLQSIVRGCGSLALAPFALDMRALAGGDPRQLPKRFVFVLRANGLRPYGVQPKGLEKLIEKKTRPDGHVEMSSGRIDHLVRQSHDMG